MTICKHFWAYTADANPLVRRGFMANKPCVSLLFLSPNSSVTALCYHGTLLSAKIFRSVHQMPHTEILKIFTDITIRRKGETDLW